jgi:hypothetical protein
MLITTVRSRRNDVARPATALRRRYSAARRCRGRSRAGETAPSADLCAVLAAILMTALPGSPAHPKL